VYLSATDVAKLLGVSPKTVSRWALTDPTMPATRIGRTVRFDEAALHRWLTTKTAKARARTIFARSGADLTTIPPEIDGRGVAERKLIVRGDFIPGRSHGSAEPPPPTVPPLRQP
jgi:excisionase family DNA binding protein